MGSQGTWNQHGGAIETIKSFNIRNNLSVKRGEKIAPDQDYKLVDN